MSGPSLVLSNAPIVEAIVDINCDLPPSINLLDLETRAATRFKDNYPKARNQVIQRFEFRKDAENPPESQVRQEIGALQFRSEDERQLVQIRQEGFAFNRLAPYTILDDYLPEIERTWGIFRELVQPVQIRKIGLRFINRILLPTLDGRVDDLGEYLRTSPRLPDEGALAFVGFLNQHAAIEVGTENHVNITLVMQELEGDKLPLIFDIDTFRPAPASPEGWGEIREVIASLRKLANRVFEHTLTDKCLNLFRQH